MNKWIPMSEEAPERFLVVLLTIKTSDGEYEVHTGSRQKNYYMLDDGDFYFKDDVIAWMPLPEACQGEESV